MHPPPKYNLKWGHDEFVVKFIKSNLCVKMLVKKFILNISTIFSK